MFPSENNNNQPPHTVAPVPAYQPPSSSGQNPDGQPQPSGDDPGKVLAIIGIILAFFAAIIGLIVSIIARKRSLQSGHPTTLATVGIVLNSIFIAINIIVIGILATIAIVSYDSLQERALETSRSVEDRKADYSSMNAAMTIAKKSEAHFAVVGNYPTTLAQFDEATESSLSESDRASISPSSISTKTEKTAIYTCADGGIVTEYWNPKTSTVEHYTTGVTVFDTQACRHIE